MLKVRAIYLKVSKAKKDSLDLQFAILHLQLKGVFAFVFYLQLR